MNKYKGKCNNNEYALINIKEYSIKNNMHKNDKGIYNDNEYALINDRIYACFCVCMWWSGTDFD